MAKDKNSKGKMVAESFLAGLAVASVAGAYFLFGSKNAKQNRKKIEAWSIKAKAEVLENIEKAKDVSKEGYEKIVDTVVNKYKKLKHVGEDKAEVLSKELKKHWKSIKKEAKEVKVIAKKVSNK